MAVDPAVFDTHVCSLYCEGTVHAEPLLYHISCTTPEEVTALAEAAIPELRVASCRLAPEADKAAVWRNAKHSYAADTRQTYPAEDFPFDPEAWHVWLVWYVAVYPDDC